MIWPDVPVRLGACSWTAKGWESAFYPKGMKSTDYLGYYAQRYATVEIDSTFYAVPAKSTILKWRDATPAGFIFAAKFPQLVTHQKVLTDCFADAMDFLHAMSHLEDKMGPLLLQFPYFAAKRGLTLTGFLDLLTPFLNALPKEFQYAVEVRNKQWVCDPLLDLLHAEGVALALIDHPWMYTPEQLFRQQNLVTAPFAYIRWLGDRHGIERITKTFNETVVDRCESCDVWIPLVKTLLSTPVKIYGYVNNHYGGYALNEVDYLRERLETWDRPEPFAEDLFPNE